VLVPVYNGLDAFKKLTASLQASHPEPEEHLRFVFIDDASPDPAVGIFLAAEDFFVRPDVHVLTNAENLGFTATINRGLAELEEGEDVLILNADTEIHGHVVGILQDVAYRFTDVGSVTPLTNRGTIGALLNWPEGSDDVLGLEPAVVAETVERLRLATPHEPAPTGVGFCMYMTRAALGVAPEFDERAFGKGYGEENDWCQRTIQSGFVHLVTPEAFVFHREKQSFGEDKEALARRNHETLCGLHPGYMPSVRDYIDRDPLARQRAEIVRALRSLTKG
jgi:GT2 family glycosyltransferase